MMMTNDNRCVICGEVIPEGRMVCPSCEAGEPPQKYDKENSVPGKELCYGCFGAANMDCKNCDVTFRIMKENLERKAQEFEMAEKKNHEGYQDPTAYGAESALERERKAEERRQKEIHAEIEKRSNQLIGVFKLFAEMAGFEIVGRIHLRHKRTGKEFR